jgi:hypothetical protein
VTFLDADDRWRPTFVERMREMMIADPDAVCSFANFVRFEHATGKVLNDQFSYYPELRGPEPQDEPPSIALSRIQKAYAFSYFVRMGEIPAFTQVMMFRRALISNLRFDTRLKVCEDTHFALRAFMRGNVPFTSEVLCEVRRHEANATRVHQAIAIHKLLALKALAPFVGGDDDRAYRDRLVKAHIDAALYQTKAGYLWEGLRCYFDGLLVRGSPMRKIKGSVRMALSLQPRSLRPSDPEPRNLGQTPPVVPPVSTGAPQLGLGE